MATTGSVIKAEADDARRYWLDEGRSAGGFLRQIDHSKYTQGVHPLFKGIKIVDCDTHFTEPPDLFTANAPASMKGRLPHVKRIDGADRWFVGDKDFGSIGGNVIAKDRNKLLGRLAFQNYDQIHAGSYLVKPRLQEMDALGVWAHVCFQNGGLTQAGSLVALNDEDLAMTIMRMFNDACAERMRRRWSNPRLSQMAEFASGTPLNFHLNAALDANSAIWDNLGFDQRLPIHAMLNHIGTAATMSNFMVSGLLDKYSELKVGLIESGAGWVPFVLEALDHQLSEFRTAENRGLKRRPKEYFAKHFWVSYWFESFAPKHMVEEIGVDRLMFETDFPHPTSLYPGVQEKLVDTLGGYDYETRKRILESNAVELFNLSF